MTRSIFVAWALAVPSIVQAQTNRPLTLDQVLELAARQNPDVLVARAREVEARGHLTTAKVRFAANPDLAGRLDDVNERSSAQSRRMVDRVEVGRENGIRGCGKGLGSFRRWRRRENRRGHDEAGPAE